MTAGAEPLAIGAKFGAYRIEGALGYGASAMVYRAVRERDGEVVALKVFRADLADDPVYGRRILHEVRAAGEVAHPHLVPIVDVGVEHGRRYAAMRFGGVSLGEQIKAHERLEVDETIRVVAHVAAGLDTLHRHGLVHRDVKPANILIDEHGAAALGDFGLSKGRGYTALTRPGQMVGTIDYIAPEVVRGEPATPASDIYALGCVAYECLTGHPPFADKSLLRVSVAHLHEEPRDPREERPDLPSELGPTVLRALAKEPVSRPPSSVAYAHMLDVARRVRPG
jgi:serine/threonine protein kinase